MAKRILRSSNKLVNKHSNLPSSNEKIQFDSQSNVEIDSKPSLKKLKIEKNSKVTPDSKIKLEEDRGESSTECMKTEASTELSQLEYPLPERLKCRKFLGHHASISGGLWKSIEEAEGNRAMSFACFLRSQRSWKCKPLEQKSIEQFAQKIKKSWILPSMLLPHGSYLLNCGSSDPQVLTKSREGLVDEVTRCQMLGIGLYNFHPGSSKNGSTERSIELIAESINIAHQQTSSVVTLIENMSCQGNTIGGKFDQLKLIIDKVHDQSRIGVCFDTCHAFAAGYDLSTEKGYEDTKNQFDQIIGKKFLKAVHLNDSKGALNCHLDRHENVGKGKLGMPFFRRFMNDPYFNDIPVVLETPECDYSEEIDLLYNLVEEGLLNN